MNQDNHNADGPILKGYRKGHKSKSYLRRQKRNAECQRTPAVSRKKEQGELCGKVMNPGKILKPSTFHTASAVT